MLIFCPECKFEREIDPYSVPPTAVMATCPRCRHRFRFRDLPDGVSPMLPNPALSASSRASSSSASKNVGQFDPMSAAHADDDPLPPGAVVSSVSNKPAPPQEDKPSTSTMNNSITTSKSESERPERPDRQGISPIPWESADQFGYVRGLYETILQVMFAAPKFFAGLNRAQGRLMMPIVFYIILGMFQTIISQVWSMFIIDKLTSEASDPKLQQLADVMTQKYTLASTLLYTPLLMGIQVALFSGTFFLMFRLVQPEKANLGVIVRVIAYSAAVTVVSIIPVVGTMAGTVWFSVCCFMGCKYALNLPWSRVFLALGPLYMIALAFGVRGFQDLMTMVAL